MSFTERAQAEREQLALLTGPRAGEMLRVALARRGHVHSWSVHHVHHRPGAGVSVGYKIILDEYAITPPPNQVMSSLRHATTSQRSDTYVLASTAKINESALIEGGGVTVSIHATRVHVWEYPYDPQLPSLSLASNADAMGAYMGTDVNLELLTYRPTRRAVLRIEADGGQAGRQDFYAKVLPEREANALSQRIQLLADSGVPCPQLWKKPFTAPPSNNSGLVITQAAHGVPLSRFYAHITPHMMREADDMLNAIEDMLDRLPRTAMLFPRKPAWVDRCEHYAHAAASAYPEGAQRAEAVASRIRALLQRADCGDIAPVHGDFYEANVYIDPDTFDITALLDVDSLGPGYRVHDWGCLLGHLAVLPNLAPTRYKYAETLCAHWFDQLSDRVDPVALCASTAGVVLSLVAGAKKKRTSGAARSAGDARAEARLRIAEEWVCAGEAIAHDPHFGATVIPLNVPDTNDA